MLLLILSKGNELLVMFEHLSFWVSGQDWHIVCYLILDTSQNENFIVIIFEWSTSQINKLVFLGISFSSKKPAVRLF